MEELLLMEAPQGGKVTEEWRNTLPYLSSRVGGGQ